VVAHVITGDNFFADRLREEVEFVGRRKSGVLIDKACHR